MLVQLSSAYVIDIHAVPDQRALSEAACMLRYAMCAPLLIPGMSYLPKSHKIVPLVNSQVPGATLKNTRLPPQQIVQARPSGEKTIASSLQTGCSFSLDGCCKQPTFTGCRSTNFQESWGYDIVRVNIPSHIGQSKRTPMPSRIFKKADWLICRWTSSVTCVSKPKSTMFPMRTIVGKLALRKCAVA